MQVKILSRQQGIKPATRQYSEETQIASLESQVRNNAKPENGDVMKKGGRDSQRSTVKEKQRESCGNFSGIG